MYDDNIPSYVAIVIVIHACLNSLWVYDAWMVEVCYTEMCSIMSHCMYVVIIIQTSYVCM